LAVVAKKLFRKRHANDDLASSPALLFRVSYRLSGLPARNARDQHPVLFLLEIAFSTRELRAVCEDAAYAEAIYDPALAKSLVSRLADLRAVGHLLELPFAEVRPATGSDPDHVVLGLAEGRTLVLGANHTSPPPPRGSNGEIEWEHVYRIIVLRLE
jgi:hypothetical protein